MMARLWMAVATIAALLAAPFSFAADDEIGIYELILESSVSFDETTAALDAAFAASEMQLHATHDVRVPENRQQARVYVFTSPRYLEAAKAESPRTISAQVLRVAVYTQGDDLKTYVNMANPSAHAMVYYANSPHYDQLLGEADEIAAAIRQLVSTLPGKAVSVQQAPERSEKHYNKYKGDGPARMMAKFRTFEKSQLEIIEDSADNFDAVVAQVAEALRASKVADAAETEGWEIVAEVPIGDAAVYFGVTNPYVETKMIEINSRHRDDGKSEAAPYPGVDHVSALPVEILVLKEGNNTLVLQYGEMWRMQLYFWDSGYRAFTANVGVPGKIAGSIEDTVKGKQ